MPKFKGKPIEIHNQVSEWLELQDQEQEIVCLISKKETKEMRSLMQNNMYYGLFGELEKQTPFSSETIKQYLLGRTFGKKEVFGELVNNKTKTSELTRQEAKEYIESIMTFCEENTLHYKYTSRDFSNLLETYD